MIRQFSHIFLVEGLTFIINSKTQTRAAIRRLPTRVGTCASAARPASISTMNWVRVVGTGAAAHCPGPD